MQHELVSVSVMARSAMVAHGWATDLDVLDSKKVPQSSGQGFNGSFLI